MSPKKLRRRYDNMCDSKLYHEDSLDALNHALSTNRKDSKAKLSIYVCDFCAGLHIGHSNPKQQRRIARLNEGLNL